MSTDNPYSTPIAPSDDAVPACDPSPTLSAIARTTFLAWEKLRLVYIAVLAVLTLLFGASAVTSLTFWLMVAEGAIAANLCYFAGPIVETYVTWLGFRAKWLRIMLFLVGLLLSCVLVVAAMAGPLLPNQQ